MVFQMILNGLQSLRVSLQVAMPPPPQPTPIKPKPVSAQAVGFSRDFFGDFSALFDRG